jgi:hypothetical protein
MLPRPPGCCWPPHEPASRRRRLQSTPRAATQPQPVPEIRPKSHALLPPGLLTRQTACLGGSQAGARISRRQNTCQYFTGCRQLSLY